MVRRFIVVTVLASVAAASTVGAKKPSVTAAFLHRLMRDADQFKKLIDRGRGLLVITYNIDSPADDFRPVKQAELLCGEKLDHRLKRLVPRVIAAWRGHDVEGCSGGSGPAGCSFGFAYEYSIFTHLLFVDDGKGGWLLDAVLFLDGGLLDEGTKRNRDRWVRQQMLKLRRVGCEGRRPLGPLPRYERFSADRVSSHP